METTSIESKEQKGDLAATSNAKPPVGHERLMRQRLTFRILACAIDVHRELGPGLLESAYRTCLVHRLTMEELSVKQEVPVPVNYRGQAIDVAYRADLIVEDLVLVELKAVETLLPIHGAQLLTYLKFLNLRVGLLLNFGAKNLMKGMRRFVR